MEALIDNFENIAKMLEFRDEDDFYLIELIGRKKDGSQEKSQIHYGSFYITSRETLLDREEEIKARCKLHNCRAYIHMNVKSRQKTVIAVAEKALAFLKSGCQGGLFGILTSAASVSNSKDAQRYALVDVDSRKDDVLGKTVTAVFACRCEGEQKVHVLPTPNGYHLLAKPFDRSQFDLELKKAGIEDLAEVKYNAPTLLYFYKHIEDEEV